MDKEHHEHRESLSAFREMWRNSGKLNALIWTEKRGGVIALGFAFLVVSAAPFLQYGSRGLLINELVEDYGNGEASWYLLLLVGILIGATLIPSIFLTIQNYLSKVFYFFLEEKFETLVIQKKGDIDVALHENPQQQDLFNRVSEEGTWRVQNFVDRQFYIFQNVLEVTLASVILIVSQWWVFLVIFIGTIPELIVEIRYGRMGVGHSFRTRRNQEEMLGTAQSLQRLTVPR